MMIRGSAVGLFTGGVFLFIFAKMIPYLEYLSMDWISIVMMGGGMFILLFCFSVSGTGLQYDTIPAGSAIINYIRRDGIIAPLLGKRVFAGESFLDVPRLGLIEDLGKDTNFLWGRKKVRFGLENISYTPDMRYANLTHELYKLGFDDTDDLYNILNIPNMDSEKDKARKTYYMTRMAEINYNLDHQSPRGAERLIQDFKRKPREHINFGKKRHSKPGDENKDRRRRSRHHQEEPSEEIPEEPQEKPQPPEPKTVEQPKPQPDYTHIDKTIEERIKQLRTQNTGGI